MARKTTNWVLLVGRFLLALIFLLTASAGSPTAAYLKSLGAPSAETLTLVARTCEYVFSIAVMLGLATRYAALLGMLYIIIATAMAHRWWTYPPAQQLTNYTNFLKNASMLGGFLVLFAAGPGRFSIDALLSRK